jgi:hypothetical protein
MAKSKKSGSNAVYVLGHEENVAALVSKMRYQKVIDAEVDTLKREFRATAATHPAVADGATSFLFGDGVDSLGVSLPDASKPGNRNNISSEKLASFVEGGMDVEPYLEIDESFVLTGQWAQWMKQIVQVWTANGQMDQLPEEGLTERTIRRLSADGVVQLKAVRDAGGVLADELLAAGLKKGSVNLK